jgi:hypothetical protein
MFFGQGTIESAADLSEKGGYGFKFDSSGNAELATDAVCHGVIVDGGTASGDPCSLGFGEVKAIAGAAIDINALVTTSGDGKFVTATGSEAPIGRTLSSAGDDGSVFLMFLYGSVLETI